MASRDLPGGRQYVRQHTGAGWMQGARVDRFPGSTRHTAPSRVRTCGGSGAGVSAGSGARSEFRYCRERAEGRHTPCKEARGSSLKRPAQSLYGESSGGISIWFSLRTWNLLIPEKILMKLLSALLTRYLKQLLGESLWG